MEGARDETHGRVQLHIDPDLCEQSVTRLGRSTLLLNSKAPEQISNKAPQYNGSTEVWNVQ